MKKNLFIIVLFCISIPLAISAASLDDLRNKIKDRESEIKKIEAEIALFQNALEGQSAVSATLKGEIKKLELQIKKLNSDVRLTQLQIEKKEYEIDQLSDEIKAKEQNIVQERRMIAELLRVAQEKGDQSLIEILLSSASLSYFFDDVEAADRLNQGLQERLAQLKDSKAALDNKREGQKKQQQELVLFKKDLSGRKQVQESVNQTKSQLLKESKNQESRFQKLVREREARRILVQQELQDIESELQRLIDPASLPPKGTGVLAWPVANPVITQGFGQTDFAKTSKGAIYKGSGHNGIDLRASIGTKIFAVLDGVVKDTGNTDTICPGGSYGKWIIIDHANNLSTVYGHLSSVQVVKGQPVSRGQVIGYSGDTGYVTGPHLHFTVYASNTYRLSKTNNCGLVPTGGYLNPLDYL